MSTLELEHLKHSSSSSNNLSVHSDGSLTLGMLQGNVGIGTSSPANFGGTTLQVNHASSYSSVLASSGAYTMQFMASQTNGVMNMGARSNHHVSITTNDSPRLTIDTDGAVSMPNQVSAFYQGNDGSWATINGGSVMNRAFTTSGNGAHGHSSITYNQSNGRFTIAKAGKYFVSFTFYCDASANNDMRIILRQNGGGIAFNHYDFVSSHSTISNSSTAILNVAANDYIEFYTPYQLSNYHGPQHSFVSIFKVS